MLVSKQRYEQVESLGRFRSLAVFALALALGAAAAFMLASCAIESSGDSSWDSRVTRMEGSVGASSLGDSGQSSVSSAAGSSSEASKSASASDAASDAVTSESAESEEAEYPVGWLAVEESGVPAGKAIQVLYTPGIAIAGHLNGEKVADAHDKSMRKSWDFPYEESAVIAYKGKVVTVDPDALLINLPDVLPGAVYDIVYSYAATSSCAGQEIPGVTGKRLDGYADGMQKSAYWGDKRYAVPCAYGTATKLASVSKALSTQGYRLLVYDVYRPMRAQSQISEAFGVAYGENEAIQASLGDWSLEWYVASGPSGHNYGTDVDVGLCDTSGEPIEMPSAFDAFDDSGHLVDVPMAAIDIQPENYREAVQANEACLALHRVFCEAGFAELASEWWHFGDEGTEAAVRAIAGEDGLDFVAKL